MISEVDIRDWGDHPRFPINNDSLKWQQAADLAKKQAAQATNERDPNGKSAKEPGSKLDAGKSPVLQGLLDYFPRACMAVADVSAFGANKYAWKGWETVPDGINRYGNALGRHIVYESIEGRYDLATGKLHAAHAAWNAFARLELLLRSDTLPTK